MLLIGFYFIEIYMFRQKNTWYHFVFTHLKGFGFNFELHFIQMNPNIAWFGIKIVSIFSRKVASLLHYDIKYI